MRDPTPARGDIRDVLRARVRSLTTKKVLRSLCDEKIRRAIRLLDELLDAALDRNACPRCGASLSSSGAMRRCTRCFRYVDPAPTPG